MAAGDYYVNGLKVTADGALYVNASVAGLNDATDVTKGDALVAVKRQVVGSVATTVHNWIEGQVLNVKTDFGAVGDGVTDDTAAVQAASDAASAAGGGVVFFPVGTYLTTAAITHDGATDVHFKGEGWGSIITCSTSSVVILDIGDSSVLTNNVRDVRVSDIRIVGTSATSHGIRMTAMHSSRVQNVRVNNCGGNGIDFDRCYASWLDRVYCNNNTGHGLNIGGASGSIGNDHITIRDSRFHSNSKGIYVPTGACPGMIIDGCDMEGNSVGLQIDAGSVFISEAVRIVGCYFENQTGQNISLGEDAGTMRLDCVTIENCQFNPGTVSAATNKVGIGKVRKLAVRRNNFNTVNWTIDSSNTQTVVAEYNKYSSCSGPFGSTEMAVNVSAATGDELGLQILPVGFTQKLRWHAKYAGDKMLLSNNLVMTSDTQGNLDNTGKGGSAILIEGNSGLIKFFRASAGSNPRTLEQILFAPIIATASLPAAASANDGKIVIEDNGAGDRNLIIYAGGERFRIDGGAAF